MKMLDQFRKRFVWIQGNLLHKKELRYTGMKKPMNHDKYWTWLAYKVDEGKYIRLYATQEHMDKTNGLIVGSDLIRLNLVGAMCEHSVTRYEEKEFVQSQSWRFLSHISDEEWIAVQYYLIKTWEIWRAENTPIEPTAPMSEIFNLINNMFHRDCGKLCNPF